MIQGIHVPLIVDYESASPGGLHAIAMERTHNSNDLDSPMSMTGFLSLSLSIVIRLAVHRAPFNPERHMLAVDTFSCPSTGTPKTHLQFHRISPRLPNFPVPSQQKTSKTACLLRALQVSPIFRRLSFSLETFLKKSLLGWCFFFSPLLALLFCSTYAMSCPPLRATSAPAVLLT